jgi:hypothetical protein
MTLIAELDEERLEKGMTIKRVHAQCRCNPCSDD